MYGIHISLKTLFLICLYFAICSTLYVSANLWLGTLVIAATIVWLIATTARAFNHHDYFAFGFSIFGWAWLVFWLGFYAETAKGTAAWDVPDWIFQIMSPAWDRNAPLPETVTAHSLQYSGPMGSPSPKPPSYTNAIRLAVCLTALFAGLLGGTTLHLIARRREARKKDSSET